MRKPFKILLGCGVALVVLLVGVVLARNWIVHAAVVKGAKAVVGVDCALEGVDVGLFKTDVLVDRLKVMEPPGGFGEGAMIDLPELYVDYELGEMLSHKVHLTDLRIDLAEVTVVKNADAKLNVEALIPPSTEEPRREQERASMEFVIDRVLISVGRVVYRDASRTPPYEKTFAIDLKDAELRNVRSADDLRGLVLKVLFQQLAPLDIVGREIQRITPRLTEAIGKVEKEILAVPAKQLEKIKDVPGKVQEGIDQIQKKIKLPF